MMLQALKTGEFETVQIPLNCIETEPLEKLIPLARSLDIGIIAMKPVAGGVFTSNRASIKWVLQHENVVPIPGMCRIEEIDDNLAALDAPLSAEELAGLEADKGELGTLFCRRCDYCMPCPNEIEASYIVRSGMIFKGLVGIRWSRITSILLLKGWVVLSAVTVLHAALTICRLQTWLLMKAWPCCVRLLSTAS